MQALETTTKAGGLGAGLRPRILAGAGAPAAVAHHAAEDLCVYHEDMRRFARRRVRDDALADDVVQDAMVAALASLPAFRGHSSLRTWLLGILTHKIHDAFRREARYVPMPRGLADAPEEGIEAAVGARTSDHDPLAELARRRLVDSVSQAIEALPASLREVFQLQAMEGLSTQETCRRLGISEANCWVRLHRARKHLSASLQHSRAAGPG
jgi:RNA polymerase sigma-70 factor (ECF subfamily)